VDEVIDIHVAHDIVEPVRLETLECSAGGRVRDTRRIPSIPQQLLDIVGVVGPRALAVTDAYLMDDWRLEDRHLVDLIIREHARKPSVSQLIDKPKRRERGLFPETMVPFLHKRRNQHLPLEIR
jgi:hypothetical protein